MEKMLLHACCAPCSSGVLDDLRQIYDIAVFFYNPNIYPAEEYLKRAKEQEKFLQQIGISYIICDYNPEEYVKEIKGLEKEPEGGARCEKCFRLRLRATAEYAKKHNYDIFTTTLSVSPHKNFELINEIGRELSKEFEIPFLEANFKKNDGYLKSINNSKLYNIYRQNYCGCKHSMWFLNKENEEK